MKLIDIFRSKANSIPGMLEQTGPSYELIGEDFVTYMHQSYMLSVIDTESWQEFADSCASTAQDENPHGLQHLWTFMKQRRAVWIGDLILFVNVFTLHESPPGLVEICSVRIPWGQDNRIDLYAKQYVATEACESSNHIPAVELFGKVLKVLNGRATQQPSAVWAGKRSCIIVRDDTSGIPWLVKTDERWKYFCFCGIHLRHVDLSKDQIEWIATHATRLRFDYYLFNEATAELLSDALTQRNSTVEALLLDFGCGNDHARSIAVVLRSLTAMLQQQMSCSLTSFTLEMVTKFHEAMGEFVDALARYKGNIKYFKLSSMKYESDWPVWYETLMTSTTITSIVFDLNCKLPVDEIPQAAPRLRKALLISTDNIKDIQLLKLNKPFPIFHEAMLPILQCRRVARKLVQLNSMHHTDLDGGNDLYVVSTQNYYGLVGKILLSQDRAWQDACALYKLVHAHNNTFIDLWKQHGR